MVSPDRERLAKPLASDESARVLGEPRSAYRGHPPSAATSRISFSLTSAGGAYR